MANIQPSGFVFEESGGSLLAVRASIWRERIPPVASDLPVTLRSGSFHLFAC